MCPHFTNPTLPTPNHHFIKSSHTLPIQNPTSSILSYSFINPYLSIPKPTLSAPSTDFINSNPYIPIANPTLSIINSYSTLCNNHEFNMRYILIILTEWLNNKLMNILFMPIKHPCYGKACP